MIGVSITQDGAIVVNLNGIQSAMTPVSAEHLIGLIAHALEIVGGIDKDEPSETLQ